MNIEDEVLARVRPPREQQDRIVQVVRDLVARVRQVALYFKLEVEPFVAGSVAKDTYLKDPDIDIFMLFPPDTPVEVVAKKGLDIARSIMEGEEKYAQHPYLRGSYGGFEVDLVPAYKLPDTKVLQTAVDRTPFHVEFVNRCLKPEQRDQVRLLKQFLKGIGTYGAEEATQGFSGYMVELLVMRFGSFDGALRGLVDLPMGRPLDLFAMLPEARQAVADIMAFIGELYDIPRDTVAARTHEFFSLFGLLDQRRALIRELSHGMRQRLIYSATFLHDPRILFIDEPLIGLDPHTIRLVKVLLIQKARHGVTVFLTTHILALAEDIADRIGVILDGRLIALGTLKELMEQHEAPDLESAFLKLTGAAYENAER
jgi:tRNA CCA-adding enzyme